VEVARPTAPDRPAAVAAFVAAIGAAGTAAVVAHALQASAAPADTLLAALAIAVAVALMDLFAFELPHGGELERFGLTDAVWVAAILLAPVGAPTLGAVAGALAWQAIRRVPAPKLIFNAGQVALAVTAAEVIWRLPAEPPAPDSPKAWALAAAAVATAFAINQTTVAAVVAMAQRQPMRSILLPSLPAEMLQWLGAVSVGLLAALAWHAHPIGLVLVAPPLLLVYLAHRAFMAGLAEREQMQDLAITAEEIARDHDLAARLPMNGQSGRLMELTASLNRMLVQLEHASGRERRLMRSAVERLQAPLRTIAYELDGEEPLADERRAHVREQTRRLILVLEEMELVALARRPGSVNPTPVAVAPFLRGVADHALPCLGERLTLVAPPEDAVACLDRGWVERALLQLLENAAAHARGGSRVELRVVQANGSWRFEVADEGGGVPLGHEEVVFEPFYRLANGHERAGLGLALVSGVAEAHAGSAGVTNRPRVGATFWLRVPA
jgi:signal transduction histidine kinase